MDAATRAKYLSVPFTRGIGVEIGGKRFPHFIGYGPGMDVEPAGELPFEDGELDFVVDLDCKAPSSLVGWWRALRVGGHLVVAFPEALRIAVASVLSDVGGWRRVLSETFDGTRVRVYRKTDDGLTLCEDERPAKTACVVRYGGFGDQLQAANILPALKRQGYHVTFMTTPKGHDVIERDPHVDAWVIQDNDQVPNGELWAYWKVWSERFDKWVNLSESVEGTLLAMPGRANHGWPDAVRRKHLGINYLEFTAELAGVSYKSEARFYATEDERTHAASIIAKQFDPADFIIVWALAGSSLHKAYPWQDNVMAKVLLTIPEARFVLVGDEVCRILEQGWEAEPRVMRTSGELSIRETLTLATMSDCVVGPETGVLNAVAFEQAVGKVCLLSHSSVENLTKHWRNTVSVTPPAEVKCYPCHRLHYTAEFCDVEPESGAAMCQFATEPARVAEAIARIHRRWRAGHESRRAA